MFYDRLMKDSFYKEFLNNSATLTFCSSTVLQLNCCHLEPKGSKTYLFKDFIFFVEFLALILVIFKDFKAR